MKILAAAILGLTPVLLAQSLPDLGASGTGIVVAHGVPGIQTLGVVAGQLSGGIPVTGAPYSAVATTEVTQTLADGSHIVHSSSAALYRDSLGRERREDSLASPGAANGAGQNLPIVFISDPLEGVNYTLDANSHTAHRMPAGAQVQTSPQNNGGPSVLYGGIRVSGAMSLPLPNGAVTISKANGSTSNLPAPKVEDLGSATMEGVQAQGTRSTVTVPVGQAGNDRELQIVDERWYSPELKITVLSRHSDPRSGETVYRLTQINRDEPLPSLFEVPADYKITDGPVVK